MPINWYFTNFCKSNGFKWIVLEGFTTTSVISFIHSELNTPQPNYKCQTIDYYHSRRGLQVGVLGGPGICRKYKQAKKQSSLKFMWSKEQEDGEGIILGVGSTSPKNVSVSPNNVLASFQVAHGWIKEIICFITIQCGFPLKIKIYHCFSYPGWLLQRFYFELCAA